VVNDPYTALAPSRPPCWRIDVETPRPLGYGRSSVVREAGARQRAPNPALPPQL